MAIICLTLGKIPLNSDVTLLCYLNKDYSVILMNCTWLLEKAPTKKILKMATLLKVRNIGSLKYESNEFVSISLYFSGIDLTNCPVYVHIHKKLYIVKKLKANLLVSNNILVIERVIIDLANKSAMISSC